MSPPVYSPGAGRRWALQRNVLVFDNTGLGGGENGLNIPPTFDGVTSFNHGANFGGPVGANAWVLDTVYFARVLTYGNHVVYGAMAVEPGKASASGYISVPKGLTWAASSPPAVWPVTFTMEYHVTSSTPGYTTLGVQTEKIVGDVWAAVPVNSDLTELVPNSPLINPSSLNRARAGLQLAWSRRQGRVDLTQHELGKVGGLTYPGKWDGEKSYLLDGIELSWTAQQSGGYALAGTYHFVKLPDTDASGSAGGTGTPFTVDITGLDDPGHPLA